MNVHFLFGFPVMIVPSIPSMSKLTAFRKTSEYPFVNERHELRSLLFVQRRYQRIVRIGGLDAVLASASSSSLIVASASSSIAASAAAVAVVVCIVIFSASPLR